MFRKIYIKKSREYEDQIQDNRYLLGVKGNEQAGEMGKEHVGNTAGVLESQFLDTPFTNEPNTIHVYVCICYIYFCSY